ncbi:hypothetical protein [Nocardioides psychrotolerans]|jgi:hypothetical protein|uniref:Nmad2 family putative nucleotide modification protein n=1 Tax=Nocardioides psychrotolerans TaxID=1005945 RepID=UPI003138269D
MLIVRLYSYKVRYDIGFAPNPFHGVCTLATCKPRIRAGASVGDWVIGVGSVGQGTLGRLVFGMQVDERLTFDEYWADERFQSKKADRHGSLKYRYGDNVYHRDAGGQWVQSDCRHSLEDGSPNMDHVRRDTSADAVLISKRFSYFGSQGPVIPHSLRAWGDASVDLGEPGRDHTYTAYPPEMIQEFATWFGTLESGYQHPPKDWGGLT